MSDLLKLLQEGDLVGIEMEKAREAMEAAKAALEQAKAGFEQSKENFEAVIARAEENGIPRAKLKKLIEERTSALFTSGLMQNKPATNEPRMKLAKAPKSTRKPVKNDDEAASEVDNETGHEAIGSAEELQEAYVN